jgi:glycosyltransferase involved in cell wall biosynthesis
MKILIYAPSNARAVDLQSVMELFVKMGHAVYLLTHLPEGDLHRNVQRFGVATFSCNMPSTGIRAYYKHVRFLSNFVRSHKIEVVFAHLQTAGLVASLSRLVTKFKLFYVRHNTDEHKLQKNRNATIVNWLSVRLAPKVIVPSKKVYQYITGIEKVEPKRVIRINYGYNFSQYFQTDRTGNKEAIKLRYPCRLLVVSVARLIPVKRHLLMFETIRRMLQNGMDVKLICLSDGPYRAALEQYIEKNELGRHVFLLGNQKNVLDYLEASDIFLHLSESEASNSALKEAGLCKKTVVACRDVGDFEDYIVSGVNGFIVDKSDPVESSVKILTDCYNNPVCLKKLGESLYNTITREFSIDNVLPVYDKLLNSGVK